MYPYHSETITEYPLLHQGKVRDLFAISEHEILMVASDRLSAFDVVLPNTVPGKGEVLTAISQFWFEKLDDLVPNHLISKPVAPLFNDKDKGQALARRAVVVQQLSPLPVEAVVRGYLIGSGWKDYQATGSTSGIELRDGLQQAEQLDEAIFTPSTKAAMGDHDENISFDAMVDRVGRELAEQVRDLSLKIYNRAADFAAERGVIIADTKFEFGVDTTGALHLIDEVLTPDSSRYWPASDYRVGISPPSYDKQFVRDYLETLDWDKTAPGPEIPDEIIQATAVRYQQIRQILTGHQSGK